MQPSTELPWVTGRRLDDRSRWLLLLLLTPLLLALIYAPLWQMRFAAPQYPDGLRLDIYTYTVTGDVQEVNTLNHYIGMARIDRSSLTDLDWIPFALGMLIVLTLRVASIGDNRPLVDLTVIFLYFSLFSMGRFYFKMYVFGHNLDPAAPFKVDPFTPAVLGTKQVANFTTSAWPQLGSVWIGIYGTGLVLLLTLAMGTAVAALRGVLLHRSPKAAVLVPAADLATGFALTALLFAVLFHALPASPPSWGAAWRGGLFTALRFFRVRMAPEVNQILEAGAMSRTKRPATTDCGGLAGGGRCALAGAGTPGRARPPCDSATSTTTPAST